MSGGPGAIGSRSGWHTRSGAVVLAWLAAAGLAAAFHRQLPVALWLMVHLLMLGAVTNALFIWTQHFAAAVLRARDSSDRRAEGRRLVLLNAGVIAVLAGVVAGSAAVAGAGALAVALAVADHLRALVRRLRTALPGRFRVTVHTYVAAGVLLLPGLGIGWWMVAGAPPALEPRLRTAHVLLNVLGWAVLPILGTLVTLWPTILHTRLAPGAEAGARRSLPVLVTGVATAAGGALGGLPWLAGAGVALLLGGVALLAGPLAAAARQRPPRSFAAWSVLAGMTWLTGSLLWLAAHTAAASPTGVADLSGLLAPLLVGGVLQVLLGALSYLLPVVSGGGPAATRVRNARADRGMSWRLVATNASLLFFVLPGPSLVRVLASMLALAALLGTGWALVRVLRPIAAASPAQATATGTLARYSGGIVAGLAAALLAVAGAVALDPAAVGTGTVAGARADAVVASGRTTQVEVHVEGMRFVPASVTVPVGDELVITLVNTGSDVHDLTLETGVRTDRLQPGERATLQAGVVGADIDGWCSVAGHRQMGMVFEVIAAGGTAAPDAAHDGGHPSTAGQDGAPDLMAAPGADVVVRDPVLPAAAAGTVHEVTLTVSELEVEVAPGVRQTRWAYNGQVPGPTLRGKLGDTFVITLVNDGTIGHSIDFHAGALAPDRPMRTIAPGERLTYRFTATRAGIWMYHCSTMPMSVHIAQGMYGAVVVDPPDLPAVDHEFLLVQGESYLGPEGGASDAARIAAGTHDLVSFNGYPMQYDRAPIEVGVGQRIRIWVLDAGPNQPTSFHVVGGQFDTVWSEGDYRLRPGDGGSQALGLFPAQGGFVELSLPQPGSYPFVSHIMSDAEKGAHGTLRAVD